MAQVTWKDLVWTGLGRQVSIKELLTILKGYGPMEVLHFESPGRYGGDMSLWLDEEGAKHITLFHLEVTDTNYHHGGREALRHLRKIFGGEGHLPQQGEGAFASRRKIGGIHVEEPSQESFLFWIEMFEQNLIDSMESDLVHLDENTSFDEIERLKSRFYTESKSSSKSFGTGLE